MTPRSTVPRVPTSGAARRPGERSLPSTPHEEAEKTSKAEAAYLRIARVLSERIQSGEYQPGGQLPNERQLAKEFGVSLMTLRRAMQVLGERGLTSSQQGRGTFVRSLEIGQAVFGLHQWCEQWTREATQVKLLEASSRKAGESVARMLRCAPEETDALPAPPRRPRRGAHHLQLGTRGVRSPAPARGGATAHHLAGGTAAVGRRTGDVGRPPQDNGVQLDA